MVLLNMGAPKTDTKFLKSDSEGDYLLVKLTIKFSSVYFKFRNTYFQGTSQWMLLKLFLQLDSF